MRDLQKQDRFHRTLPGPSLPPPGSSPGSARLSDLGRPGAAVSPQQQNASQLPPNAKLRQRTPANMKTVLRRKKKRKRESTFLQLSGTAVERQKCARAKAGTNTEDVTEIYRKRRIAQ